MISLKLCYFLPVEHVHQCHGSSSLSDADADAAVLEMVAETEAQYFPPFITSS